jgi:hypothetical protein
MTADAQLSAFGEAFWRAVVSVGSTLLVGGILYSFILTSLAEFANFGTIAISNEAIVYFATAFLGLVLYASSEIYEQIVETKEDEADGQDEEEEQSPLERVLTGFMTMSFVIILGGLGALLASLTAEYVSASLAPAVAFVYPILDWKVLRKVYYPVTPAALVLIVSLVINLPLTAVTALLAFIAGRVLTALQALIEGFIMPPLRYVFEILHTAGLDETVLLIIDREHYKRLR